MWAKGETPIYPQGTINDAKVKKALARLTGGQVLAKPRRHRLLLRLCSPSGCKTRDGRIQVCEGSPQHLFIEDGRGPL